MAVRKQGRIMRRMRRLKLGSQSDAVKLGWKIRRDAKGKIVAKKAGKATCVARCWRSLRNRIMAAEVS